MKHRGVGSHLCLLRMKMSLLLGVYLRLKNFLMRIMQSGIFGADNKMAENLALVLIPVGVFLLSCCTMKARGDRQFCIYQSSNPMFLPFSFLG